MQNPKTLVCASYLSILFAPVIVPLFIFFTTKNSDVKVHSKRAMISHAIPIGFSLVLFILSFVGFFATDFKKLSFFLVILTLCVSIYFVLYILLIIWNIIQAIKAFKTL